MTLSYNPTVANDGLVLYMDFVNPYTYSGTGNTSYDLISGKSYSFINTPTFDSTGPKCVNLNGSTHYLSGNMNQLNFGTGDFTIQANIKLNGLSNGFTGAYNAAFVCAAAGSTGSCLIQVGGGSTSYTNIGIYHETTGNYNSINYNFSTNVIYNLALARSSGVLTAYVNGTAIGSTTTTNLYDFNKGGNFIGRHYFGGYEQYFKGNVYSLQAYSRGLSSTEILQNFHASKNKFNIVENIVNDRLIANYDCSYVSSYSGIGVTWNTLAGSSSYATLTNGPTFSGTNGGHLIFDGSNDYAPISTIPATFWTGGSWSVEFCIYNNNPTSGDYGILGTDGQVHFLIRGGSACLGLYNNDVSSTFQIPTNSWTHIVFAYRADNYDKQIYINGVLNNSSIFAAISVIGTGTQIGKVAWGYNYFNGRMAFIRFYQKLLSAQEIRQNYNAVKNRFGLS